MMLVSLNDLKRDIINDIYDRVVTPQQRAIWQISRTVKDYLDYHNIFDDIFYGFQQELGIYDDGDEEMRGLLKYFICNEILSMTIIEVEEFFCKQPSTEEQVCWPKEGF